jgi:nucleoside diphosphate kinase
MVDEVRAVYAADRGRNCIDGSDSTEGAAEELARWFGYEDMNNYTRAVDAKIYA